MRVSSRTSIVLREQPSGCVRDESSPLLAAQSPVALAHAIKTGKRTFEAAGGPRAYFGDPAAATPEEGSKLVDALGGILEEAVMEELA